MEALAKASEEASAGTAVEAAVTAPTPTEKKWLKATVTVNLLLFSLHEKTVFISEVLKVLNLHMLNLIKP